MVMSPYMSQKFSCETKNPEQTQQSLDVIYSNNDMLHVPLIHIVTYCRDMHEHCYICMYF